MKGGDTESDEEGGPKKKKHRDLFNKSQNNDGYGSEYDDEDEDADEDDDEDNDSDDQFEQNAFNN